MQWRCNYEGREMQEKEIIKLGYLGNEKHQSTLVISKEGIAPTLDCCMGGELTGKNYGRSKSCW